MSVQILKGGSMSMICDITSSLEANPSHLFSMCECDVETQSLECTHIENGLDSEARDYLCDHS